MANPAAAVLYPNPVQTKAIRGLDYYVGGYIQMFKAVVIKFLKRVIFVSLLFIGFLYYANFAVFWYQ